MARSSLIEIKSNLQSDGGSVLWSFVQGEQLEFEVSLAFLLNANASDFAFEAVVIEAANVSVPGNSPTTVQAAGVQTTLVVRVPLQRGTWNSALAYTAEDVVLYAGSYYKKNQGTAVVAADLPSALTSWDMFTPNKVYIQFPTTLGTGWLVQPNVLVTTKGFFELRVTELTGTFPKTWKPLRGLVELLFSPTSAVPG